MDNELLYESIFTRRAVRKYDEQPLDSDSLDEITQFLNATPRLDEITAHFEIAHADNLKGCSSPHAILAFGKGDFTLVNIGYTLQSVDLYLQAKGFGSIWMGMAKPKTAASDYSILLAFGKTDTPLRSNSTEFKRKNVLDISNVDNEIARAARLAPSAVNFQPWKLEFLSDKVIVKADPRGIGKILPGKMYLVDLGIFLKYVELALLHIGKTVTNIEPSGKGKSFSLEVKYE